MQICLFSFAHLCAFGAYGAHHIETRGYLLRKYAAPETFHGTSLRWGASMQRIRRTFHARLCCAYAAPLHGTSYSPTKIPHQNSPQTQKSTPKNNSKLTTNSKIHPQKTHHKLKNLPLNPKHRLSLGRGCGGNPFFGHQRKGFPHKKTSQKKSPYKRALTITNEGVSMPRFFASSS